MNEAKIYGWGYYSPLVKSKGVYRIYVNGMQLNKIYLRNYCLVESCP
jgi:hypothetical protein